MDSFYNLLPYLFPEIRECFTGVGVLLQFHMVFKCLNRLHKVSVQLDGFLVSRNVLVSKNTPCLPRNPSKLMKVQFRYKAYTDKEATNDGGKHLIILEISLKVSINHVSFRQFFTAKKNTWAQSSPYALGSVHVPMAWILAAL